jgi:hypothetical protein
VHEEGDPDCYRPEYRALVDIVLNYGSDATQLGSDEDLRYAIFLRRYGEGIVRGKSDSSSHGSKPQLAPAHEWSDDCVSEPGDAWIHGYSLPKAVLQEGYLYCSIACFCPKAAILLQYVCAILLKGLPWILYPYLNYPCVARCPRKQKKRSRNRPAWPTAMRR